MKKLKLELTLFLLFFKTGLFTFGGGIAMISLIEREFSVKRTWIEKEELMDMITISESTPGPIAINMATYVGFKMGGVLGSILSTLGVVLPSFIIIMLVSLVLNQVMDYQIIKNAFVGINCAVSILILFAGISLMKTMPKSLLNIIVFACSLIITLCILFFSIDFSTIYLIIIGGVIGAITYALKRRPTDDNPDKPAENANQEEVIE